MGSRGRGLNGIEVGPPPWGEYAHILRRTDRTLWPWRERMYDHTYVAREVTHPDGHTAPTMFVLKGQRSRQHRMSLIRKGWRDVTDEWMQAWRRGWRPGESSKTAPETDTDKAKASEPVGPATMEELRALSYRELQKLARSLDMSASGTTGDLRLRLSERLGLGTLDEVLD